MNAGNTSRFESASLAFICGQNLPVWPPKLRFPLSCSLLAFAYAIRIHWSDGHNSGTCIFNHFREICPCAGVPGKYRLGRIAPGGLAGFTAAAPYGRRHS
jgi:hypothetical protein